eukprot:3198186-Karenia_brevis.AAC.1
MEAGSGVCEMPCVAPARSLPPDSSDSDKPKIVGEQMKRRGTSRNWNEEGMANYDEDNSSSSTSSSSRNKPVIQDAENQEELIKKFQEFHTNQEEGIDDERKSGDG